jgi:hypothetical protein
MEGFYESELFDGINRSCDLAGAACLCMGRLIMLINLFGHKTAIKPRFTSRT